MAVIKIVPMPGAVGDKGDEGAVGPRGQQGETGLQGPAGADALWSYNGEYNPGAGYSVGDVVTFDGQLWYRKNSNGGNVGDTPSEGLFWDLLAAKGADGSVGAANTGDITFDGVKIIGAGTASGDGYGNATMELVPDGTITSDQYIVIDPTAPNHIHIRAGGEQDSSNADLFLGGEDTHVRLSDSSGSVQILGANIFISSYAVPSTLHINTYEGAVINSQRTAGYLYENKVVATLGDLPTGATGTFETSDSKLVTVTNGIITSIGPLT